MSTAILSVVGAPLTTGLSASLLVSAPLIYHKKLRNKKLMDKSRVIIELNHKLLKVLSEKDLLMNLIV